MNKNTKRALYESIMKDVSKTIKKKINENVEDFEVEELLDTLTDDDVFYIMHEETARKLRDLVTENGKCFTIDEMIVFVPSVDDQNFFFILNKALINAGDYNFFTVATCASDGDDLIGNIREYCNLL